MAVVRLAIACGVRPEWLAEGEGDMLDPAAWPFELVTLGDILALDDRQRGVVEGAMLSALERIKGSHSADMEVLKRSQVRAKPSSSKRKAA